MVRQVNKRATRREVNLWYENGRREKIKQTLYEDDAVLGAEPREYLQHIVKEFKRSVTV